MLTVGRDLETSIESWTHWQKAVVELLQVEFPISFHEVDWDAWKPLYEHGRTPKSAIDRALERDY